MAYLNSPADVFVATLLSRTCGSDI